MRDFPSIHPLKPQYSFKKLLELNVVKASEPCQTPGTLFSCSYMFIQLMEQSSFDFFCCMGMALT